MAGSNQQVPSSVPDSIIYHRILLLDYLSVKEE